ncbi:MAG: TRAP transporter substrate-binding protein DctP [Roseovarius sp.]|nr:TRAP transporter substrate-binding protein DctP [Roseovarius sp.]MCY4315249.1 TRAP transporter substrate-binding protein DctP [Roseovarius sp.]
MKKTLSLGALMMATSFSAAPVLADTELVAATWLPPQHQYSRYLYSYWAERVAAYDGSLKVEVELGSPRVTPTGNLNEIADGLVQVSSHFAQYTPSELPVANAPEELAMTFDDPRVIIATSAEFNMTDPQQQAEWASKGVVFGASQGTNWYKLVCNTPVTSMSEIQGAKLRLPGRAPAEWANSTGGVTVSLSSNEQYGALDKGALTCTTTTAADAWSRKLHEVATHITDMPITLFWAGLGHGYNADFWEDLTVDQRRALLYADADAMAALIVDGTLLEESEAEKKLKENGVTFHQPADDLVKSIEDFRAAQPGKAVGIVQENFGLDDAEDLLARFQSTMDKWTDLLADVPVEDKETLAALMKSEIVDKLDLDTYGVN